MDTIKIDDHLFYGYSIPLPHASLLLIQGKIGMLGCGYLNLDTAEKLEHALAIVTGVRCYDDMLHAEVKKISSKARELGVRPGMSGKEALLLMK